MHNVLPSASPKKGNEKNRNEYKYTLAKYRKNTQHFSTRVYLILKLWKEPSVPKQNKKNHLTVILLSGAPSYVTA